MKGNHRTGIIAICLFMILLSPILLIHAHDIPAQYPDNTSLSAGKATYAPHETLCITLTASPEKIVFFNIISPTGIIYTALPATDHEYQFKPDITGSYVVNVLLLAGDDETLLTTGFVVVDPGIVFGAPKQGEAVVGEPVNWSQCICVTNHEKFSISNFSVSIPLPPDHSNLSSGAGSEIIDSSIPVDLAAGECASFNISYQTPPVRLAVAEEMIGISDLIPPDAFDIGVYKKIGVEEGGLQLTDKIAVKQVTVRHNSSTYYHNIPVAIESQGFDEIVEFVDDAGMVAEMPTERSNETLSWTIPKLSNRTYTVVGVTREQGDAEIGESVEWQLNISGTIVRYKTPAPFTMESKPVIADGTWQKEIVVGSNASVHYSNITAYSRLDETEKSNLRLFWLANGSRIDVTDSEEFDVSFSDTNGNDIIDIATWNVPMLSNQSFEVEADITVINVQSYPTVGGNWTVEFETVGCANLTITAVDGTAWSNADEEGDLQFLEIECGDQTLDYRWINDSVFIENYCCNLTGHEVSKVLTPATHTLQFRFGSDVEYAHNQATDLSGWDYCQPINISNTAGELSYHQVKIELNSSNDGTNWNWTNNGNDTIFTYYNSTTGTETEIPFWIESWNSTAETSTIWVNVTSLANNTNTTIYLYYGNTSASSASNGTNTFEFFDDFEIFNAGEWAKEYSYSTLSQVSDPASSGRGQVLRYYSHSIRWRAFKKTTYTFTNGTIHFEFYRPSSNEEIQFCWRIVSITYGDKYLYEFAENEGVLKFQKFVDEVHNKSIYTKNITCPANTWHNSKIVANGSSIEYWVDGTEHLSFSDTEFSSGNLGGRCKLDMYLNDVFVCKYASSEPTVNIGIEETSGIASPDLTISTPQNNSCTNDNTTTFAGTTNIAANITYSVDGNTNETACNNCTSFSNTTQELTDGSHNVTVYGVAYDNATDTDSETVYFTVDTTAPAPITGLANQSSGSAWINWTWTNPTDADFDHTEVWLNETFYANVTQPAHSYTATGLDAASWYEIRTRTVDDCQNINTVWVNDTAKTQEVSWWDSSWSYRRVITLQGGNSELTDFPYYIHLSDTTHIQDDGDDLRFLDGLTELKYEMERFETNDVDIWLKIHILPANGKNISMYYGNSDASSGENRTGVWDSNYKGVWHMHDTNTTVPISIDEVGSVGSVSNLQGVTTDGTYLYTSAGDSLYKYWLNNGTSVSSHATTEDSYSHNGDIKCKNGIIYIAVCNYNAQNPRHYSVSEYGATDFSFIREHKDLAEYWTAGVDYHDGYWWVLADTGDPNWVHRYNATESGGFDNSSYTSYALGNTNSQGITWVGDEIFEANHGSKMGRFRWNGTGFEDVFTYTAGTNFPSGTDFQGSDYYNNQLYIARRSANNIAICDINDSFSTNTISDSTSDSNTGTKRASGEPDEVAGKIGYAQDFDGTNDDIGTANSASLKMGGSSWTIESWLYSSASYADEHMLVEYGTEWVDGCYQLTTTDDHTLKANFRGVSGDAAIYDVDWTDSQWHHATAVLDTDLNRMYIYYDGNEGQNVTENNAPGSSSDMPLWFACRGGTSHFSDVTMDEVRVSDIARSADWLNMSYEVVDNQSGKVTIGTEENQGEGGDRYIPPDPTTIANTTGNFWMNHTWSAGSGNVTNSYNVSVNGAWHNGTTAAYNDTYTPHAWQNITVYAFNTSGTGTLSTGSISQDAQIPNNAVTITNTSSWSGDAGNNVYVDYDATDADSDTPTFSCNRTGLFTDFSTSTGQGNWTATAGTYYVDFGVSDGYGSTDNYTMTIAVGTPSTGYIPPDPKNIQSTAGNFWMNHTWEAGTGNVTNSYNVSVNGAWHNGTTAAYNDTYTPHAWQNITVYAFNTSGTGTLSTGSISQDAQIPNNAVTITNTSGWSGDAGNNVYVDYDATDADSDTPTFSCNRTGLFTDFSTSTGQGNWTATAGTYYADFGVSDGYGSTDNYTMTIAVGTPAGTYVPPDPTTLANTTGNFRVNYTWNAGSGNVTDSFNVSMNDTWTNDSDHTYMNVSVGSDGWANITIWAWNASGTGTLSAGCVSDEVQAPEALLTCTCGDICVNETGWWRGGGMLNGNDTPIRAAVDNASSGETIYVHDGTYSENIYVAKRLTLTGEDADVVNATNSTADSHVFNVSENYVNISGFNVTGATGNMKAGIYIGNGVGHCNISGNTISDNYIGIYLDSSSSGNRLADNTIYNNTWDNYLASSTSASSNNTLNGTKIDFTYCGDMSLKGVGSPASDPTEQNNIGKFINATNRSAGAWMFINFSYSDADVSGLDESSLKVWKYNGTAWVEDGWNGSRYLDTANNVVGVNATSFSVFAPMASSSPGYTGWNCHQLINISNTAQNMSYYPVRIDLNASNVGTDWNWAEDENATRFTYYNYSTETETEIPFWIESWNSTAETSTIWVNVTYLANTTNTTIYLYYGNTSASSASNGTNTFEFFDDFPGSSPDDTKWTYTSGTPTVSGGTVRLNDDDKIYSPVDFGIPCSMRARSKASDDDSVFLETHSSHSNENYGLQLGTSDKRPGNSSPTMIRTQSTYGYADVDHRHFTYTDTGIAWANYAIYDITRVSTDVARYYQNDYLLCNETEKVFDVDGYVGFHVWDSTCESTVTVDWVFVRKYTSPEPVVSISAQPQSCPYGDICVNETGWWYNNGVFNTSSTQIQHAIDNATTGDLIYVYNGNYTENVDVTKQLTLTGEGTDGVNVTNSTADSHVFNVSENYVNISGFNVTGATGGMKAGIYIGNGVDRCNISSNTVSDNYIGIYLDSSSSDNRLADNTISDNTWDNYLASSRSAFSNNTLNGTTISLTYSGDILLKGVGSPASDPTGKNNTGKFINATNQSAGAWMFINFSYSDADVSGLDESSLAVWRYNGAAWVGDGWNGSRYLDTTNNVVGVNVTSFSVFAPMGITSSCPSCTLVSVTPGDLKANSTGAFTAIINCTAPSGINRSRFFMTRTVEGGMYPGGPPNRWSIRPPVNDVAQSNGSFPQILRAYNRGEGDWYDFAGLFTDNFSYAVHDVTSSQVTITNGSNWAELNYTWVVEPTAFGNSFFLNRKRLETETKNEYNVYANHPLLVKFWDLERMRGTTNYTACVFGNILYSGTPNADLKAYYCNASYRTVSEALPDYGSSDATANMTGNVLLMHMNESSGTITDYSGEGNNGTGCNGILYDQPGKFNTSLGFDGNDDYIAIQNLNYSSAGEIEAITVCAWIKTSDSGRSPIVDFDGSEYWSLGIKFMKSQSPGTITWDTRSNTGVTDDMESTIRIDDNIWHHVCGVFNSSTVNDKKIYIDGQLNIEKDAYQAGSKIGRGSTRYGFIGASSEAVVFNGDRNSPYYSGLIDEVAIWNRSLSTDEIKELYNRGVKKASLDNNCAYFNSFNTTDLDATAYTSRNSSYSRSCYGVTNSKISGIDATDTYYIAYESDTTAGNYTVRYANGSSSANVSFANSNVAWSLTNDTDNWVQAQFTPDIWFSEIKDGDQFQLGVYVESDVGSNYTNFTLHTDDIGDVNYPISNPSIAYYENAGGTKDYDLTGSYAGDMTINANMAKDPDAPGTVEHSLQLYNSNGILNTTIDSSFYSQDDSNVDITFDTSTVSDAEYRIKVTAVADDNLSDVESYLTTINFTIDNTGPTIQLNDPDDKADLSSSTVNFNWTATDNLDGALSCDLVIDGVTNQSGIASISGQPTNYSISGISNGSHNWYMTCRDDAANAVTSETRTFGINDSAPDATPKSPPNGSVTPNNWVILNAAVTDADDDDMTVYFYANDNIDGLNASEGLVYIEENVADGSTITYNLTALPIKPDEDGLAMLMHFDNRGEYGEHTERGVANAVYDFTGNENNGTLGSTTTSTAPVWNITGGKFAGAFEFDGSDDYIDCGDDGSLNLDNSSFTVSLWFNTRSNATDVRQTLLSKGSTTNSNTCLHLDLFRYNNESINMRFWGDDLEVNTTITANTWHHAAFTYNTPDMNQTIYLDGACVGSRNTTTNLTGTDGNSIWIGRRACSKNDNSFNGFIDEVALYTRTLSATEILNQYRLEKEKYYWKVNTTDGGLSNESDVRSFYAGYKPDLRVINVTFGQWDTSENRSAISETGTGCHVKENRNITINVTIANYADGNVTSNFDLSFFDSAGVAGNWSGCFWNSTYNVSTEGELGSIATGYPHNTTHITGYWNPSLVGTHNISTWVNPANPASESAANTTNNNASAVINVSAWQKYYGNVSGSIALSDSASDSLYDWTWSNETDVGYVYIVNDGVTVNWSTLHALGCDSNNALNTSGHDFLDADTHLGMVAGSNNSTGFVDNNITELFGGGNLSTASFKASFTVYGNLIPNVPVINSTMMVDHASVESANFVTGILWDAASDTNGYYDTTNETLVFVTKIRVAATGLGGAAHNYEFAAPCTLNPVVGGDLDIYMELK